LRIQVLRIEAEHAVMHILAVVAEVRACAVAAAVHFQAAESLSELKQRMTKAHMNVRAEP